jgi:hypothetical protein
VAYATGGNLLFLKDFNYHYYEALRISTSLLKRLLNILEVYYSVEMVGSGTVKRHFQEVSGIEVSAEMETISEAG